MLNYRKNPIISLGLIFVQKAILLGLFSGELIFGGAYYWKELCVSKCPKNGFGLTVQKVKTAKAPRKQPKTEASTNSPWTYSREGLLTEGFLRLRFGGLIFERTFFLGGGGGKVYYRNYTRS